MTNELPPLKFTRRRYQASKYCPCGKSNRDGKFVPYEGYEDKGYCHSCGETFLPEIEKDTVSGFHALREKKQETLPTSFIDPEILRASMRAYTNNVLVQFLIKQFGAATVERLVGKYLVGTSRNGEPIFWHIDINGRIRTGKLIPYDLTGHRVKDAVPPVKWAHTEMKLNDFRKEICLFGEHLLRGNNLPCAIVESEKTALISSLYFPDLIWLACGGKDHLTNDKMQALKGRQITLYPDLDGFDVWSRRAVELSPMLEIRVSDFLERNATTEERAGKLDIADYLLRFTLSEFNDPKKPEPEYDLSGNLIDPVLGYPVTWKTEPKTNAQRLAERHQMLNELIKRMDLVEI